MLLVLGSSFLLGGYKNSMQSFNKHITSMNSGLLVLAMMSLLVPAVLHSSKADSAKRGVKKLDLSGIAMGEVGFYVVAQVIRENPKVQELILSSALNQNSWSSVMGVSVNSQVSVKRNVDEAPLAQLWPDGAADRAWGHFMQHPKSGPFELRPFSSPFIVAS